MTDACSRRGRFSRIWLSPAVRRSSSQLKPTSALSSLQQVPESESRMQIGIRAVRVFALALGVVTIAGCGAPSLHVSVVEDDPTAAMAAIESGADVNELSEKGNSPLLLASMNGRTEIVEILITAGADVSVARSSDGATPLHLASQNGHIDVVRQLLSCGAPADPVSSMGDATPLLLASQYGHGKIVELLLAEGANANHVAWGGFTPLYLAAQQGHLDTVCLLVEGGADASVESSGSTPQKVAKDNGHDEIVHYLASRSSGE